MSKCRTGLRNMYRETRFSIPFNNTSIKKKLLLNKLGLSQEIDTVLSSQIATSSNMTTTSTSKNSKTNSNKGNNRNNTNILSVSNFKNNVVRSLSPSDKGYSSDLDDNLTLWNESSLTIGNCSHSRLGLRSPTPDFDESLPISILSPILQKGNSNSLMRTSFINHDSDEDETGDVTLCDTHDHNFVIDEKSFFFRRANSVNVIRKTKSLDTINITSDFNDIHDTRRDDIKMDFNVLKELDDINSDKKIKKLIKGDTHENNHISGIFQHTITEKSNDYKNVSIEQESSKLKKENLTSDLSEKQDSQSFNLTEPTYDESIKQSSEQLSKQLLEHSSKQPLEYPPKQLSEQSSEQSLNYSFTESSIKQPQGLLTKDIVKEENQKEKRSYVQFHPSSTEQMILQFVADDEKEKSQLQQVIIDQTTQRLIEQQQEVSRLSTKISHQKVKMEERKALHRQLSHELELKRRQSAELRLKLSTQFEKSQQQQKELSYYKELNTKCIEENRLLQQQIRELTKVKFLKLS